MKTVILNLSDKDYEKYSIQSSNISFDNFVEKVRNVIAKEALAKCNRLARDSGLDKMTIEDINKEIQASRNAKSSD
ncbi:MAG: hypothetical protein WD555_01445 [Fulvivirga sp.]